VPCLFACAEAQRVAAPASCHSDAASGPAVAGTHGCPSDGLAVALAVKRADAAAPIAASLLIDTTRTGHSPDVAAAPALRVDPAAPSPPRPDSLIPLRI
jgi:hypothetical protein